MTTITARLREGTQTTIETRHFTWLSDEPPGANGTDAGPTPYEILLGSLAACTGLTLRLYADHKGIDLDGVNVTLEFDRIHADDCQQCDERTDGWIERIQTQVEILGTFDEAQKKRLAQVAARCPIHKTLTRGVEIFDSVTFA